MKYVILSTDSSKEYFELLPLVCYSWKKLGYSPVVLAVNTSYSTYQLLKKHCSSKILHISGMANVRDSTMSQLWRLFAYKGFEDDDVLLTSDADMVIGKDIFTHEGDIVSYGFDLTGRSEIPICYVKATAKKWEELMGEFTIPEKAYSEKWEDYWSVDQQLLTQRAKEYGFDKIKFVDRGNNNKHGLPTGRWDRHDWQHIPADIIDVHMKRNDFDAQIQVFKYLWPGDDYQFLIDFKNEL